ncbi:MAG: efflux transporter outer membrane subunit [Gluconacetobacter diazotrophicus]|nr:efflux transporter outer membrane subunit [Gluconacetobacter diazotrophicus]
MRRVPLPLPLLAASFLASCTVGPDFRPPQVATPALWGPERTDVPSRTVAADVDKAWWRSFKDPELDALVGRLVTSNLDLRQATERVEQGVAQRRVVAAQGLPHLDYQARGYEQRYSPNGFLSLVTPAPYAPLALDDYSNALSASWQLDLFGRVRRNVEAARADTEASIEDRRAIALMALSELAQDYLQLRGVQDRIRIARDNVRIEQEDVRLVEDRFRQGVATTLDLAQARGQLAVVSATIPPLEAQQAALINAIGLLLAEPPRALEAELMPPAAIPPVPPTVPVGVPGTLVRRRPDVREAEARLHAATARVGVAVAQFYPDVSLTGMFGADGRIIGNAFSLPSKMYMAGPTITLPLFEGGQLRGQLQLRKSQEREAGLAFQKTVLQAWTDVDNALTAYADVQRQRTDITESVKQDRTALDAARQRYQQGAADFLNVEQAEAALLSAQDQLSANDTQIATSLVALYRALGGGWEAAEPPAGSKARPEPDVDAATAASSPAAPRPPAAG